jgi:integrase
MAAATPVNRQWRLKSRPAGLRISECLGLQWADVDYDNQQVFVHRSWTGGNVGTKSAASKAPVPSVPLLAGFIRQWQEQAPYGQPTDWVFASTRLKGKQPRVANMLVEDHLRPAAVKAGVLKEGEKVRFGFHNLRHCLAEPPRSERDGGEDGAEDAPPQRRRYYPRELRPQHERGSFGSATGNAGGDDDPFQRGALSGHRCETQVSDSARLHAVSPSTGSNREHFL